MVSPSGGGAAPRWHDDGVPNRPRDAITMRCLRLRTMVFGPRHREDDTRPTIRPRNFGRQQHEVPGSTAASSRSRGEEAVGDETCCVLVPCTCGLNEDRQLGDGTTVDRSVPVQVPNSHGVSEVAAGGWHTAAFKKDGTVWTFGENDFGQQCVRYHR